ncbi:MAG: hypothetical protein Q8858_07845 [Bacteroidota bacterium]|nr:hypothetical protein [Bacteroidota bacterium]
MANSRHILPKAFQRGVKTISKRKRVDPFGIRVEVPHLLEKNAQITTPISIFNTIN